MQTLEMNDKDNSPAPWVDTSPKSDLTKSTYQNLIDLLRKLKVAESVIEMVKKDLAFDEINPILKELQNLDVIINDKIKIQTTNKFQTPKY